MRVAFFYIRLGLGGIDRVIVSLANALVQRGLEVEVVLLRKEGEYIPRLSPQVTVTDLGMRWYVEAIPKVVRYFRNSKADVLVSSHIYMNTLCVFAKLIARSGVKLVICEHGPTRHLAKISNTIWRRLAYCFFPKLYFLADARVVVSEGSRVELAAVSSCDDIEVIYNPVVDEDLLAAQNTPVTHPWFADGGLPVVISAGRLHYHKNYPLLIRAFVEARKHTPCRLVILGEGPERKNLEHLVEMLGIADVVSLPGFAPHPVAYFAKADLFVLSSIIEGSPVVLVEALLAGVPVVSVDCLTGPGEILENGRYGKLVPVNDVPALAAAIREALEGQVQSDPQARRARAMDFSVLRSVEKYMALFSRLCAARSV